MIGRLRRERGALQQGFRQHPMREEVRRIGGLEAFGGRREIVEQEPDVVHEHVHASSLRDDFSGSAPRIGDEREIDHERNDAPGTGRRAHQRIELLAAAGEGQHRCTAARRAFDDCAADPGGRTGDDPGLTFGVAGQGLPRQGAGAITDGREADQEAAIECGDLLEHGEIHGPSGDTRAAAPKLLSRAAFDYKSRYATDKRGAWVRTLPADGFPAGRPRGRAARRRRDRPALAHSAAGIRALPAARPGRSGRAPRRQALSGAAPRPAARVDTAFLRADEARYRRDRAMALDRRIARDRPILLLSGNSVAHALVKFGGMAVGVPACPVSANYGLMDIELRTAPARRAADAARRGLRRASEALRARARTGRLRRRNHSYRYT